MALKLKEWQKVLIAFVISYIILYLAQALLSGGGIITAWGKNPTFYIYPIIGFFFAYYSVDWVASFFEAKIVKKPWFIVLFLIMALLAWHVALVFYVQNNIILELKQNQNYLDGKELNFSQNCKISALSEGGKRNNTLDSYGIASCIVGENYVQELKNSAYLIFVLSVILGWIANLVVKEKD